MISRIYGLFANWNFKKEQNKTSSLALSLILGFCLLLTSCGKDEEKAKNLQELYHIQMGETSFHVPVDYLVDSLNRIDAEEVKKIKVPPNNRDSRFSPHNYVILMGTIPDVSPLQNGRLYTKAPTLTQKDFEFNMSYNPGGGYQGNYNSIQGATEYGTVKIPDFSNLKDGLITIGYNDKPKGLYENLYIYIKSKKPLAYVRCGRKPEQVNPGCWAYLVYNNDITLNVIFLTENLDWFAQQGGIDKVLNRVNSWQSKNKLN